LRKKNLSEALLHPERLPPSPNTILYRKSILSKKGIGGAVGVWIPTATVRVEEQAPPGAAPVASGDASSFLSTGMKCMPLISEE
jgi:hypothetical protein